MIAVIQCAARKRHEAGRLTTQDGRRVMFVADPERAPDLDGALAARPDDPSDRGKTWRDLLLAYNGEPRGNPLGLCRAIDLYAAPIYGRLDRDLGVASTFILSAGWGLVSGDFLLPDYDITFSAVAAPYKKRKVRDHYCDFAMLPPGYDGEIVFFGGKDYVGLFCDLTRDARGSRTVFYNAGQAPEAPGCRIERFPTTMRTNWHYACAEVFLDARAGLLTHRSNGD